VLGAASGIGKSSAEALASLGAGVLCADRDAAGAEATAAGIRGKGGAPNWRHSEKNGELGAWIRRL